AAGGEPIVFDADALARPGLGWIVENRLLVDVLWRELERSGVRVSCPARVDALEQGEDQATLRLEDGTSVAARIVVAADGAGSPRRPRPPRARARAAARAAGGGGGGARAAGGAGRRAGGGGAGGRRGGGRRARAPARARPGRGWGGSRGPFGCATRARPL